MKISVVQSSPVFGDLTKNSDEIISNCKSIESTIIVFPELAFSGYDFKTKEEALLMSEEFGTGYTGILQEISSELNKIFCVGFVERIGDKIYNAAALIFPDKKYSTTYHKVHLFFRERFIFEESQKGFFVVNYPEFDINIGPMICYDWRFPEAARTLALKGADIILCPSNLVTPVWHISTPSRALENKVYLAISNRTGTESRNGKDLAFNGGSVIYNYNGSELAKADKINNEIISAEIFPNETRDKSFNEFNDIFKDRRPNLYL
jgi:predicted amidohydrolase